MNTVITMLDRLYNLYEHIMNTKLDTKFYYNEIRSVYNSFTLPTFKDFTINELLSKYSGVILLFVILMTILSVRDADVISLDKYNASNDTVNEPENPEIIKKSNEIHIQESIDQIKTPENIMIKRKDIVKTPENKTSIIPNDTAKELDSDAKEVILTSTSPLKEFVASKVSSNRFDFLLIIVLNNSQYFYYRL